MSLKRLVPISRGIGAMEVFVLATILFVVFCILMLALPRMRENSRADSCRWNLRKIGRALALNDQISGFLPELPEPSRLGANKTSGPLALLLQDLGREDLGHLDELDKRRGRLKKPLSKPSAQRGRVADFICPSDSSAFEPRFQYPVNYRATTGSSAQGEGGAFALGRKSSLATLEARDGLAYTAGFSERLVGDGLDRSTSLRNYAVVSNPVSGNGSIVPTLDSWRGDAGSDWREATWRSTLYNHSLLPNSGPSLIDRDGRSARMGTSSAHGPFVFVLFLDEHVQSVSSSVDSSVWRAFANADDLSRKNRATDRGKKHP